MTAESDTRQCLMARPLWLWGVWPNEDDGARTRNLRRDRPEVGYLAEPGQLIRFSRNLSFR